MLQYQRAGVAQLVEQLFCKQQVVSSSLSTGSRNQRAVNPLSFLCPKCPVQGHVWVEVYVEVCQDVIDGDRSRRIRHSTILPNKHQRQRQTDAEKDAAPFRKQQVVGSSPTIGSSSREG